MIITPIVVAVHMKSEYQNTNSDSASSHDHLTDYGFKTIKTKLKTGLIKELFTDVAESYDIMNDTMSVGMHRLWKKDFVKSLCLKEQQHILDVAGGTGDISKGIAKHYDFLEPKITLCDLTESMVKHGRNKCLDQGISKIKWCVGNAETLPFADNTFDVLTIAFGLRNITHKERALSEFYRVLKPNGRLFCMEFTPYHGPLRNLYDLYSFKIIPKIGEYLAKDGEAYQYLIESIRKFPEPESLKNMITSVGFSTCSYSYTRPKVVAIHQAEKQK